jgi:hypothetical protein
MTGYRVCGQIQLNFVHQLDVLTKEGEVIDVHGILFLASY